jgi:general stress protein 26
MSARPWQPAETRRIAEIIKDIDICMLVTRADGGVRGRPMSNNQRVEYDGDSWFFSYRDTPKIREIEANPTVELAYVGTDKGAWVSIEGRAEVVDEPDRKRDLWDDSLKMWFDGGPDDERIVLLKVSADRIHAWADGKETLVEAGGTATTIESRPE